MADKIDYANSYDFSKNITGLEINPAYILGLESILGYYMLNVIETPSMLPELFEKFNKILGGEKIKLTDIEANMYTLFSLQQLLRYKAKEQGLEKEYSFEISSDELKKQITEMFKGDSDKVNQKIEELNSLIKIDSKKVS